MEGWGVRVEGVWLGGEIPLSLREQVKNNTPVISAILFMAHFRDSSVYFAGNLYECAYTYLLKSSIKTGLLGTMYLYGGGRRLIESHFIRKFEIG